MMKKVGLTNGRMLDGFYAPGMPEIEPGCDRGCGDAAAAGIE
jgi:hypothetical protein